MKRLVTILMLAAAIILGGMSVEAKTTKKTATSSSLTLKSFTDKVNNVSTSESSIKSLMKGLGFSYQSSYRTRYVDDYGDEYDLNVLKFTKNGVEAQVYPGFKIVLKFSNSTKAKAFVTASKSAFGNKLKNLYGGGHVYLKKNGIFYWFMTQSGNTVTIETPENTDGGETYYY